MVASDDGVAPIARPDRIEALDVIRGFALIGILLANVPWFQQSPLAFESGGRFAAGAGGVDGVVAWLILVFVQGKFISIFALLFGAGFVLFVDRLENRGAPARRLFARRLAVLAVFGTAHGTLVWFGDILLLYAVLGFALLCFTRTPARRLVRWAVGFFAFELLLLWMVAVLTSLVLLTPEGDQYLLQMEVERQSLAEAIARSDAVYAEGTFAEITAQRANDFLYAFSQSLPVSWTVLGMFCIGAALARAGALTNPLHAARLQWIVVTGFSIGLPAAVLHGVSFADTPDIPLTMRAALSYTLHTLAAASLSLAYAGTLVILLRRGGRVAGTVARLAPMGRLALSNYLLQSLVFTFVFYGYGLGLYGRIGLASAVVLALLFLALQVVLSRWWLQRLRMGPAEWLWRCLTYGRRQPMRVPPDAPRP